MKLLVYYIVTERVRARWKRLVEFQRQALPEWDGLNRLVVAEPGFDPGISVPVVHTQAFRNGLILFAPLKNAAIRFAVEHGFDWLWDCDADTAILRLPTAFPETGYSAVPTYRSKPGESPDAILKRFREDQEIEFTGSLKEMEGKLEFPGSSRFLTRRDIFSKYRYYEEFEGYGGEDIDYHENILAPAGVHQSPTDARCLHIWHDYGSRPYGAVTYYGRRAGHDQGYKLQSEGKGETPLNDPEIGHAVLEADRIQGWMSSEELEWLARTSRDARVTIEVGSWKGRSTKAMALATLGRIYAVDHWRGSSNPADATSIEVAARGHDAIFAEFCENLKDEIASGRVIPVRMENREAARSLPLPSQGADFVFIDSDHGYERVREDILSFRPFVRPEGILSGHDFSPGWPGVVQAVAELAPGYSIAVGSIWKVKI